MSNRTLIEINHDYTWGLDEQFVSDLKGYLSGGSGRSREALERYGVKVIAIRHHSENYLLPDGLDGFANTPADGEGS